METLAFGSDKRQLVCVSGACITMHEKTKLLHIACQNTRRESTERESYGVDAHVDVYKATYYDDMR